MSRPPGHEAVLRAWAGVHAVAPLQPQPPQATHLLLQAHGPVCWAAASGATARAHGAGPGKSHSERHQIAINGRHYCTYSHRIPLQKVEVVTINGDVEVDLLEYRRAEIYPEQYPGYKNPTVKIPMNKSLRDEYAEALDTPFTCNLEEFGIGHELEIIGRVKILPHSFYVNLQSGSYVCPHPIIPLHINPRFRAGYTMVRNSWVKGKWGTEEKAHCSHFRPGRPFCLKIVCSEDQYSVYVDGSLMDNFKYRCSPQIVDTLHIHGDIVLKDIVVK